jgi:hypothetical protein
MVGPGFPSYYLNIRLSSRKQDARPFGGAGFLFHGFSGADVHTMFSIRCPWASRRLPSEPPGPWYSAQSQSSSKHVASIKPEGPHIRFVALLCSLLLASVLLGFVLLGFDRLCSARLAHSCSSQLCAVFVMALLLCSYTPLLVLHTCSALLFICLPLFLCCSLLHPSLLDSARLPSRFPPLCSAVPLCSVSCIAILICFRHWLHTGCPLLKAAAPPPGALATVAASAIRKLKRQRKARHTHTHTHTHTPMHTHTHPSAHTERPTRLFRLWRSRGSSWFWPHDMAHSSDNKECFLLGGDLF